MSDLESVAALEEDLQSCMAARRKLEKLLSRETEARQLLESEQAMRHAAVRDLERQIAALQEDLQAAVDLVSAIPLLLSFSPSAPYFSCRNFSVLFSMQVIIRLYVCMCVCVCTKSAHMTRSQ